MAAETLYQKHLRTYAEDALVSKFRLEQNNTGYQELDKKTRNSILDEGTLLTSLLASTPQNSAKIDLVKKRLADSENVRNDVGRYLSLNKNQIITMSNTLQTHLHEYSNNEVAATGFVTHTIVSDYKVENDQQNKMIVLDAPSKSEYGVAVSLNKWRDASKFKIYLRKK